MLDFKPPTLDDRGRINDYVLHSGQIGCDVSFVNTYLWRAHYDIRVAFTDDAYYKCYLRNGTVSGYCFPMTRGDIRTAVDRIVDDARERGNVPFIGLLNEANAAVIRSMYGDRVQIAEDRDSFDYVYLRENLANLAGKKYHAKRNHISRFFREHDDYSIKEICRENHADVLSVCERWQEGAAETGESEIIRDALEHFDTLGMFGLLLYVGGSPIAVSIGSAINGQVCDVNFEKAVEIDEAYAVINNEFAKRFDSFTLFNREEDMGLEGLRRSKLSYHPDILLTKSTAVFVGQETADR